MKRYGSSILRALRRYWLNILGALVTVICLFFAFKGIDFANTVTALREANYWWSIPVVLVSVFSIWLRAYRWRLMLEPIRHVPLGKAYSATMIGFMANNLYPARLGEIVRAYAIGHSSGVSKSSAFATIVVERAFDLLAILFFLALLLPWYKFDRNFQAAGYVALAACVILFVAMLFLRWRRAATLRFFEALTSPLPERHRRRVSGLLHRFVDGFEVLARGRRLLWITALSVLVWVVVTLSYYLAFFAFGLHLPIQAGLLLLVLTALAVMAPSAPGFVGPFEWAAIYGMMFFEKDGVTRSVAASYALYYHAIQFVPITLLGLYHLRRERFSLTRAVKEEAPEATP